VTYDGTTIRYLKNGATLRQVTANITQPLYLDSSFNSVDAQISNLQFARFGSAPQGSVTFYNGTTALGTVDVVNSAAQLTIDSLTTNGTANITAVYNGNGFSASAISSSLAISVSGGTTSAPPNAPASNAVTLGTSSPNYAAGDSITLTANVGTPPSVAMTNASLSGSTVSGAGTGSWNQSIRSAVGYTGGASVSFTVPATSSSLMIGLNTDPTTDDHYTSIDWAFYTSGTSLMIYENGTYGGSYGTFSATDVLSVTYDGTTIRYLKNGTVLRQVNANITQPLYLDSSFTGSGPQLQNLQFKNGAGQVLSLVPTPTGSVTFYNGQTSLGTVNLVNGVATLSTSAFSGLSSASITALYSGNSYYTSSVSAASTLVQRERVVLTASSSQISAGSSVTLNARLTNLQSLANATVLSGVSLSGNTVTKTPEHRGIQRIYPQHCRPHRRRHRQLHSATDQ